MRARDVYMAWHEALFPQEKCFARVSRQIAGFLRKSVGHGLLLPYRLYHNIDVFQWSVLLGEFYVFIYCVQ